MCCRRRSQVHAPSFVPDDATLGDNLDPSLALDQIKQTPSFALEHLYRRAVVCGAFLRGLQPSTLFSHSRSVRFKLPAQVSGLSGTIVAEMCGAPESTHMVISPALVADVIMYERRARARSPCPSAWFCVRLLSSAHCCSPSPAPLPLFPRLSPGDIAASFANVSLTPCSSPSQYTPLSSLSSSSRRTVCPALFQTSTNNPGSCR